MSRERAGSMFRPSAEESAPAQALRVLAYRSSATSPPNETDVQRLLRSAQSRNNAEGLTGVLIFDRGQFFQWLEGPTEALGRVWNSIAHDPRHHDIEILRDEPLSDRIFDGWDLRISRGATASVEAAVAALESGRVPLSNAMWVPRVVLETTWDDIFATVVIPRLRRVHGRDAPVGNRALTTSSIWHADPGCASALAAVLIAPELRAVPDFVDKLLDQGASLNGLYQEVFEPAQLALGQMWEDDRCDDFRLTIGLARLQTELIRVTAALPAAHAFRPHRRVLLSAQPEEPHRVNLLMSSEVFARKGWDVRCQPASDDQTLADLVHEQWFDVLKLSQSSSLRRDYRLPAMRDTIDSARAASLNRALIILVDGRTAVERPEVERAVHANASSRTVLDGVPVAEALVAMLCELTPLTGSTPLANPA